MTVDDLASYLKQHWPAIREQLLRGTYKPQPVKRVEIPKPGGVRKLGIPTRFDNRGDSGPPCGVPSSVGLYSINWTVNWSDVGIVSFDMRTSVTFMSAVGERANA
jgi:hypothetical protein